METSILNNLFVGFKSQNNLNDSFSEYLSDETNGYGKLYINNPDIEYCYNGLIVDGKMNGNGLIIYTKDLINKYKKYSGSLKDNKFDGNGILNYENGDVLIGEFSNGLKHGPGKLYNSNGILLMDNVWKNDIICGKINYSENHPETNNIKLKGCLYNSIKIGKWEYYNKSGQLEMIEFYYDYDEIDDDSILYEKLESIFKINKGGYPECIKLINDYTDEELMNQSFVIKEEFKLLKSYTKNISISIDINNVPNNTLYLYFDENGNYKEVTQIIDGIEYKKIIYLNNILPEIYIFNVLENHNIVYDRLIPYKYVVFNESISSPYSDVASTIYKINDNIEVYYRGELNNNYLPHGKGIILNDNKIIYDGTFYNGYCNNGSIYNTNIIYSGEFQDNIPSGQGTFYNNGIKLYEGSIINCKRQGFGISYWVTTYNKNWEGKWHNDMKHGKGILYDDTGCEICKCTHEHNQISQID
jgi:hypothetical protein